MLILGIETSCDETAAAVFDHTNKKLLSNTLFSQIDIHKKYGGVVPEIASRSHLEKIDLIVNQALQDAGVTLDDIGLIAVTNQPGLAGSLLVGFSFAKSLAWAKNIGFMPIDHNHGHIASAHLNLDGSLDTTLTYPYLCLSVSGGHSSLFLIESPVERQLLGNTIDDAAGEAFDKIAKIMGLGYPGGAVIEHLAGTVNFTDFFKYPRTHELNTSLNFTFSGLKTAVLYNLISRKLYDQAAHSMVPEATELDRAQTASSLLVCIGDILVAKVKLALKMYPFLRYVTFVGGVSCNKYLAQRLADACASKKVAFKKAPNAYCTDNAAMIACAASNILSHKYHNVIPAQPWDADINP